MGRPKGSRNKRPAVGRDIHHGYVRLTHALGNNRHQMEHRAIVERAIGRRLRNRECVHHANVIKADNSRGNLVALQNDAEHAELHRKMRVRAAGGDPWRERLCGRCGLQPATAFYCRQGCYSRECITCARHGALRRSRLVDKEVKRARDASYYQRRTLREPYFWRRDGSL